MKSVAKNAYNQKPNQAQANTKTNARRSGKDAFMVAGNLQGPLSQKELRPIIDDSSTVVVQRKQIQGIHRGTLQRYENKTGLPDPLRTGIESLSGIDMGDVRVQRNSPRPARLNALAYTQGTEIHLGPGQERHLPHEAWHAVQQKLGRVKQTTTLNDLPVNDDARLEEDADLKSNQAAQFIRKKSPSPVLRFGGTTHIAQRLEEFTSQMTSGRFISDRPGNSSQMSKMEFLTTLKGKINQAANELLSQIDQTADECPYIVKWFGYYATKDAAHIEQAVKRFAPMSAEATTIEEYIGYILSRVEEGIQNHIDTGSIEDVPDELITEAHEPEDFLHIALGKEAPYQFSKELCGCQDDENTAVIDILEGKGEYTKKAGFMIFGDPEKLPFVGWKAHIGATIGESAAIADAIAGILCDQGIDHKFDVRIDKDPVQKFVTIYPPRKNNQWAPLITELESKIGNFTDVKIEGNMRVGETGRVWMRFGQIRRLTPDLADELRIRRSGMYGRYQQYTGKKVDSRYPLIAYEVEDFGEVLFFVVESKLQAAMKLEDGDIVPDPRQEANPLERDRPPDVEPYDK